MVEQITDHEFKQCEGDAGGEGGLVQKIFLPWLAVPTVCLGSERCLVLPRGILQARVPWPVHDKVMRDKAIVIIENIVLY